MKSKIALILILTAITLASIGLSSLTESPRKDDMIILSKSNTVVLSGEVDGTSVGQVITDIKKADSNRPKISLGHKPIYLFMNTPGGSIQDGLELIEYLNGLNRDVSTVTLFSASMGFQIVQGLGERLILRNGVLMSHRAAGSIAGNFGGQRPSQLDNRYNLWLSRLQEMDQQTVKRTNGKQTLESYQKAYADELWLTGKQSVEGGYADRIVTVSCDSSLDGVTTHTITFFGLEISYDISNCPVFTSPMNIKVASPESGLALSNDKVEETKKRFVEQYEYNMRTVSPFRW